MRLAIIETSRDWVSWALLGLGVSFPAHQFIGGLCLALAAGSMIARHRRSNAKHWAVMATSGVVATIAVIATQGWDHFGVLPQLIMALSGALSGWGINMVVKMMDRFEKRSSDIADKLVRRVLGGDEE
ncbi:hypothetical protein DL239_21415 [Sedimentitalea sp. CY04]|uniref:Phage holin family protein n=1 Tax=Parasedimentitalea denitrificans TaxID=2211118 RepID=A0ABX0WCT2_9RHOB|nr:hypothetical protein [Sedimentitalea sp. CY04]NIZ63519.1 hypothetical protein [Sedimentitalea sp. CY04]